MPYQERHVAQGQLSKVNVKLIVFLVIIFGVALWTWWKVERLKADAPSFTSRICDDADKTGGDYSKNTTGAIEIPLDGKPCFSGYYTIPSNWKAWQAQLKGNDPHGWVAQWWDGSAEFNGPFTDQQLRDTRLNVPSRRVRLEGIGTVKFFSTVTTAEGANTGPHISTSLPTLQPNTPEKQTDGQSLHNTENVTVNGANTPPKDSHPPLNIQPIEGAQGDLLFTLEGCERTNALLVDCWGLAHNSSPETTETILLREASATDDKGNGFKLYNPDFRFENGSQFSIPPGGQVKYFLRMHDHDPTAQTLDIKVYTLGSAHFTFQKVPIAQ